MKTKLDVFVKEYLKATSTTIDIEKINQPTIIDAKEIDDVLEKYKKMFAEIEENRNIKDAQKEY